MQGVGRRIPEGTKTMISIRRRKVLTGRTITYAKFVVGTRHLKTEIEWTRITVVGNQIDYLFDVTTPTFEIGTKTITLNYIISTPRAKAMTFDLKDFHLNTDLPIYAYMKIPLAMILNEIIQKYKWWEYTDNDYIHFDIRKGMYGLPQAGRITHNNLKKHLEKTEYARANTHQVSGDTQQLISPWHCGWMIF